MVEVAKTPQRPRVIAVEEDDVVRENGHGEVDDKVDDVIPGPKRSFPNLLGLMDLSRSKSNKGLSVPTTSTVNLANMALDLSRSGKLRKGKGMLASPEDLNMPADVFAQGCMLLQQAALGNKAGMEAILAENPKLVNFRDYDRRTALHVACSEGHLHICEYMIKKGARVNRSDRWGGSPLDDAHRHHQSAVITYLRQLGASSGSQNNLTNFITAAAEGDLDEVKLLLSVGEVKIDEGDYDRRTALHLAAGEGHTEIVQLLCEQGANVNIEDRWGGRPLDDARASKKSDCVDILEKFGASAGKRKTDPTGFSSTTREMSNLEINFDDLEMVDRIGKGSFGEIYKCRWRGTLVAAKCIQSSKIRKEWLKSRAMMQIQKGGNIDDAIQEMDEADMTDDNKEEALADFRQEISVLKALRHPNIVLLLAYSATENLEVMVSELMKCSLLDIFKAHIVHGTKVCVLESFLD